MQCKQTWKMLPKPLPKVPRNSQEVFFVTHQSINPKKPSFIRNIIAPQMQTFQALFASHLPLQNLKLLESGRVGKLQIIGGRVEQYTIKD